MIAQISEEQSINGAAMICTTSLTAASRFDMWVTKHIVRESVKISKKAISASKAALEKANAQLLENGCSLFRNGYVDAKLDTEAMKELIGDLGGSNTQRDFFFLGGKSDLSYFWRKFDEKNSCIMLRSYIESIEDGELKKRVLSTMQQARLDGLLAYDSSSGTFALTEKGRGTIYKTDFVKHRLEAETNFLRKAREAMKIDGLENTYKGDKFYIFDQAGEATPMLIKNSVSNGSENWLTFASENGKYEIKLPDKAIEKIAFKDMAGGEKKFKELSESIPKEIDALTELVQKEKVMLNKADAMVTQEHEYQKTFEEIGDSYMISVGENDYEKLTVPKSDAEILNSGQSIKVNFRADREYTVKSSDQVYTVNADGAKALLGKGKQLEKTAKAVEKVGEKMANTAKKTVEATAKTANTVIDGAVNIADTALTAVPPAKIVSTTVNAVYKVAQSTAKVAEISAKTAETAVKATTQISAQVQKL